MIRRKIRLREPSEQVLQRSAASVGAMVISLWMVLMLTITPLTVEKFTPSRWPYHASTLGAAITLVVFSWVALWALAPVPASSSISHSKESDDVARLRAALTADTAVARNTPLARVSINIVIALSLVEIFFMAMVPMLMGGTNSTVANLSNVSAGLLSVVGTILVCTFYSESRQWAYVAAAIILRLPWAMEGFGHDAVTMRHSIAMTVIVLAFIVGELSFLRAVARNGDRALSDSTKAVIDTASRASATAEAARIDGLVHDHILAALLLTSRADAPEDAPFIRRSAAGALAALSEISAPEITESADGKITVTAFASRLIQDVRSEDPDIRVMGRGSRTAPIPADVATSLHAAAMEAVRNSLRHAAGGSEQAVTRQVTVYAGDDSMKVVVADDGVGFDLSTATKGRYGVTGSILGRLKNLEGGSAEINSAPSEGTQTTLTWADPEALSANNEEHDEDNDEDSLTYSTDTTLGYFRQIANTPTEKLPVAPIIRSAFVLILGLLYLITATLYYYDPPWVSPVAALIFGVSFGISLQTWLDDPLIKLKKGSVVVMTVSSPAALAATLWAWDSPHPIEFNLWTLMAVYVASALLAFANFPRAALATGALSAAVLVVWSLVASTNARIPIEIAAIFLIFPLVSNRMQHKAFLSLSQSAAVAAKYRRNADGLARDLSAAQARRKRGNRVDGLARPLLERLAAGERTTSPVRVEAAQLEASLRDDLRARCFRGTDVARAADDARRAGVRVDLMDDGALKEAPEELRQKVIEEVVAALDGATAGAVIVRIAPPGRNVVATILTETAVGANSKTRRLEISAQPVGSLVGGNNDQ